MGTVLLLKHSEAGSAACRSCDSSFALARQKTSAPEQSLRVLGEVQPPKANMITLLTVLISILMRKIQQTSTHPKNIIPVVPSPPGRQSCPAANLLRACGCAAQAVWRVSQGPNQGFVQISLSGTHKHEQNLLRSCSCEAGKPHIRAAMMIKAKLFQGRN